jgi:GWxTD domain-containing protein
MKKKILLLIMVCFCFLLVTDGYAKKSLSKLSRKERKEALKNLAPRYRHWLEKVHHISLKEERKVFLALKTNRNRDIFIRSFWLQRDPTPGTDDNEYKHEIETRFIYVQKYFKRGSSKPGWMTDMGRFWMILGKPNSIERFDSKAGLYPAQVWYYFGDKSLGLPTYFSITYFKPHNMTEWKFYNPSVEGPAALLIPTETIDDTNFEGLYDKIKELAPELAMPAITMIPNEIAPGFRPPMRNNLIVSNIHEAPRRKINVSYATHFLNYKGFVDVESSVNYIENSKLISVTRYGLFGYSFVNISLRPKKISVGFSEEKDQYYFSYDLSISLKKGETFIYEEKKHFDFYMTEDKLKILKGNGLVIHHTIPVIPGKYKLSAFAMNSVGKEFTYFDKDITVPVFDAAPVLSTPVLGYRTEDQQDNFFFPYRFNNKKLFIDTAQNFRIRERPILMVGAYNLDENLWKNGKVAVHLKGLNERNKYSKNYEIPLKLYNYSKEINLLQRLGEDPGLNPDYYEVEVKLLNGSGKTMDTQLANFSVSPVSNFGYAMETFNKMRVENPFYFNALIASQYEKSGDLENSETYYTRSIKGNPRNLQGYIPYLSVLNKRKKYTQVLVEVEKLKGDSKLTFDYFLTKATALYGMKDFKETINQLLEANKIYDSDTRVLNLLGFSFLNLGNYEEALKVFEASLRLSDKQPLIINTIAKVKKEMSAKSLQKSK